MVDPDLDRTLQLAIQPWHVVDRGRIDLSHEGQAKVASHRSIIGYLVDLAAVKQLAFDAGAVAPRPLGERSKQRFREAQRGKGCEFGILGSGARICRRFSERGWLDRRFALHRQRRWRIFP